MDAHTYRRAAREDAFTGGLIAGWTPLYLNEFRGITEDGHLQEGRHPLTVPRPGEEAPVAAMVAAATSFLGTLAPGDRARVQYDVDAVEWQTWANPEFMQFDTGLRLDSQPAEVREAALALVAASLSPEGTALVRAMMRINGFLGEVVGLETILNEFSYHVAVYGRPHLSAPWGWQLFGHHCAVNCLVVGGRMVVSPLFLGAEPDAIDVGPHAGPPAFAAHIDLSLRLMAQLSPAQRAQAVVFAQMVDPAMPPGRVHPGDERHLGGAFQDNRVIPFEGIPVADLSAGARDLVLELVEQFVLPLPAGPRAARMREVASALDETWLSWIGGHEPGDVFYVRVQSPVVMVELDHHCGVFLDYDTPRPFHVHTVVRTPHGNDYGRSWVRQWQAGAGRVPADPDHR
ncbi:DUF3500 domain-containing protein [Modestobacter sp. I12A-02628]|uniref:DUF3500 domain-containing protein n=2 Tax=Goekera deserti TaxID=2497753 RepID=A0A7K3WB78_9ACTN|nr:DUF3500 domain-containing protein [Goekera deserti]NDI47973.1 DUF3500 domain-containing protein [Goekera deserti]NEL53721.1 DUF3500 domain-containing protein [Goekera deserti]